MNYRRGLTMVEAIIIIAIILLLVALVLPSILRVRGSYDALYCRSNMRQIGLGLTMHENDYSSLPPLPANKRDRNDPRSLLSWMVFVLPYIDQGIVYTQSIESCRLSSNVLQYPPHYNMRTVVRLYVCPSDSRLYSPLQDKYGINAAFTSYIGVAGAVPDGSSRGLQGVLGDMPGKSLRTVHDGLSNTVMLTERPPPNSLQAGWWYPGFHGSSTGFRGPNNAIILNSVTQFIADPCYGTKVRFTRGVLDNDCDRFYIWSLHPTGSNFLFADGSVRFLKYTASEIIVGIATSSGGEVTEID